MCKLPKKDEKIYIDIGMCQVLGMDEGIHDMLTYTYRT
jgi:hypothetical protein